MNVARSLPNPEPRFEHVVPLAGPTEALPARASVVIIGGGIMGTSIAYHLAAAGVTDVVLLERDTFGSGSSAKPLGGVRATFSDAGNILLGHRSLQAFESFGADLGTDIGLRQVGYLFLCRTEAELAAVESSVRLQNELGCNSRMITPAEATDLNPLLEEPCLLGASFSPRDGYAEPARVVGGYASAARRLGARLLERAEVLDITTARGVHRVATHSGAIAADAIVIAAGVWSTKLGAMVGVDLPITAIRRQIGLTPQLARPFPTVPFTLDLSTTLYFHNHRNGMLLGISDRDEEPGMCREFSYGWTRAFDAAAEVVAPSLAHQPLDGGWAGLYESTPDDNAMIGRAGHVPGVLYATGFSGHGFLQGPAVGEVVRDLYLDRDPFLDPTPFSADRFRGVGSLLREVHII